MSSHHHQRRGDYREGRETTDQQRYAASAYAAAAPATNAYGSQTGYAPPVAAYPYPSQPAGGNTGPNWRWWIPSEGISREVIQADIQRYLGNEAVVRPGQGTGENEVCEDAARSWR
jgi:hypothetical protein